MGILTELEQLSPTKIVSDLEAAKSKITDFESRIAQLEAMAVQIAPAIQAVTSLIPGGQWPAEVATLLASLPKPAPAPNPAPKPDAIKS